jgi:6-phosphogluconolactonase (cycloisomerase 2 family)
MKTFPRIAAIGVATLALVGGAATAANAAPATSAFHQRPAGSVFVQTDNTAGNTIVAYDRAQDGTLTQAGSYATGGLGGILTGSAVDHTASEGALARSGSSLFAVNAGSNTITSFAVDGSRLIRRQVLGSGGTFPVSIAARGRQVFVLNARDGGSIQGYLNVDGYLVRVAAWHRDLGLDPNATPEFTHTPGEVAFTPDGSKLVVSTKGNTSAFDVFSVNALGLSAHPVVTSVPAAVPFGFSFNAEGTLVTAEAGPNAVASFTVNRDGTLTQKAQTLTGQQATCWIVVDGKNVFASNAGSATLSGYNIDHSGAFASTGFTESDAGTVDATTTADGRYLYAQAGAAGIVDEFSVASNGTLTRIGSVTVPGAVAGEGITAS